MDRDISLLLYRRRAHREHPVQAIAHKAGVLLADTLESGAQGARPTSLVSLPFMEPRSFSKSWMLTGQKLRTDRFELGCHRSVRLPSRASIPRLVRHRL
jgi:hypothetical protein